MEFEFLPTDVENVVQLGGSDLVILSAEDMVDVLGNAWYLGHEIIRMHRMQLHPDFFDLSTGIAGELLQKCSNYRVKLIITGMQDITPSESLQAFIRECNRGGQIVFE